MTTPGARHTHDPALVEKGVRVMEQMWTSDYYAVVRAVLDAVADDLRREGREEAYEQFSRFGGSALSAWIIAQRKATP